jgi:hypothetical protein
MATPFTLSEPIKGFLNGLSSKSETQRAQAAHDLSHYASHLSDFDTVLTRYVQVATAVADMPSEVAKVHDEVIQKRLRELVHGGIPEDQSGGLAAIGVPLERQLQLCSIAYAFER